MTVKRLAPFIILLLLSLPSIWVLLSPGFYEPHDLHHLADIYQMFRALEVGQFPPRLGPDFSWGYGYPLFNFYYVLPFYLGAFWFSIFRSLTGSFEFVFILSLVISVFGMYLFLREFVGKWPSIVGAALFLYTPYRALQVYVRGAMGEALSLAILPFVTWAVIRVIRKPKAINIAIASLAIGLFLLSHNYLWALSLPFLVIFCAGLLISQKEKIKSVIGLLASFIIGVGLSFYWLFPALLEQKLVASLTPFRVEDHFPFIKQLVIPSWGYGASVPGSGDGISFQIGIVNLLVAAIFATLFLLVRNFGRNNIFWLSIWALAGLVISVFLMNIRSLSLWQLLPFYQFIQFPWRLLFLTTFFTSIIAGVLTQSLPKKWSILGGFLIAGAALVLTFSYFKPSQIFYKSDNEYLARFFADRTTLGKKSEVSSEYLDYSEDYLLLPKWVSKRPESLSSSKIESTEGEIKNIKEVTAVSWQAEVESQKQARVILNSYYFPGWFARLDGEETEITPGSPYGQIEILVPAGKHTVEFFWQETPLRKMANFVSLVSLLTLLLFCIVLGRKRILAARK